MKIYYKGSEFEFICPDTFMEENTLQRFMLLDIANKIGICYSLGYNKGYVKWIAIPTVKGHGGVTKKSLETFLTNYYQQPIKVKFLK